MSTSGSFGLKKLVKQQGSLGIFDITNDTQIKMVIANAGASNTVGVYGKIQGQNSFSLIDTLIGNSTKVIDVSYYDFLDIEIITYDSLSNYVDVSGSGFVTSLKSTASSSASGGNVNVANFPEIQNVAVINSPQVFTDLTATTPTVSILNLGTANTEYELALPVNTKKINVKVHDYSAPLRIGFVSGGEKFNVPRGCSFTEESLKLISGKNTLYLSSTKDNIIVECLSWA
jgi:hypothetical protein